MSENLRRSWRPAVLALAMVLSGCAGVPLAADRAPASGNALARSLLRTDPAAAQHVLERALSASPRDARLLNDLGIAFDLQGRHEAAQAEYRKAIAADPAMDAARANLMLSRAIGMGR